MSTFLMDDFVAVAPGQAYRLLPYGPIVKNGRKRIITKELASLFKLPHFKPPIKIGSHADATPAGGQIIALEVREDGLYAITELTPKGQQVFSDGDYRYHSPEVIWEDGELEHPETGELIPGPFIVGDALLHTPHLGEAAAFYTTARTDGGLNINKGDSRMTTINTNDLPPDSWVGKVMEQLIGLLKERPQSATPEEPATPATPPPAPDETAEFKAVVTERDDFAAKVAEFEAKVQALEAEKLQAFRVTHFATEFKETILADNADLHTILAGLDEETAKTLVVQFRALAAQAEAGTRDVGGDNHDDIQGKGLHDRVIAYSVEHKTDYQTAFSAVIAAHPELYTEWKQEARNNG